MAALQDFKQNILAPLLRGEQLSVDTPVTLFAAELEHPLDYIFESERWDELSGATRRVARAGDKLRSILAADGYGASELLHNTPGSIFALCHDEAMAKRWAESIERAVAQETDIMTVSTVVHRLTAAQLTRGLYRAPRSVIGVPGVNDYQERINRYYGLASPSTVPSNDAVAQRRHFGEVVALLHGLMLRAKESRQILPFYEALPFAERCASCGMRPAERLDNDDKPVCGVCLGKRSDAIKPALQQVGIIWLEAVGLLQLLEQQRTPSSYQRLCSELNETLHTAIPTRLGVTVLTAENGCMALIAPANNALEGATSALEAITMHYNLKAPTAFAAAVALSVAPGKIRALSGLAQETAAHMKRSVEGTTSVLDVRLLDQPFDRFRKSYSLDEARQLIVGVSILREAKLSGDLFPELAAQAARGSAGLYYTFERSKLPQDAQQAMQRLERAWDMGAAGPRFYSLLSAALALAKIKS